MTEKQKMLDGQPYDCSDDQLLTRWHLAHDIIREFNQTSTRDLPKLNELLGRLLGSHGSGLWIAAPFFCDYGENIHIGSNTEINMNCVFLDCNTITIGSNVLIGPNVQIYAVTHPVDPEQRMPLASVSMPQHERAVSSNGIAYCPCISAPVSIGDNSWIGGSSVILPGVSIGSNTTIGAGSVVTKSIPDNCLAVGNPCRVVRTFR